MSIASADVTSVGISEQQEPGRVTRLAPCAIDTSPANSEVRGRSHQRHLWKTTRHRVGASILRGVVDDDDEVRDGGEEAEAARAADRECAVPVEPMRMAIRPRAATATRPWTIRGRARAP